MRTISIRGLAFLSIMSLPALSYAQGLDFPYVNENGEEIFGKDYVPQSAGNLSLPLYIARPNAGIQVPDDLLLFTQEAFRPRVQDLSLPNEPAHRQVPATVPLLRDIRQQFEPLQVPRLQFHRQQVPEVTSVSASIMRVHYVFVGQGAGAVVELPCGIAVIDLGGEYGSGDGKVDGGALFVDYLKNFFAKNPQYNNTIDTLILSHPHADHINGSDELKTSGLAVRAIVDNGQTNNSGTLGRQSAFRQWVKDQGGQYAAVELARQTTATGVTNAAIDPFACATISAFWGGANELLSRSGYENPNNHSVVVRIDFGQASFLFLGDLQHEGAADLLAQYEENLGVFDVDVFQVSHHGADGDTTDDLLNVLSPRIAIISMGTKASTGSPSAWQYGHPRLTTLKILQEEPVIVTDERNPAGHFWGAPAQKSDFKNVDISRAVFGTGWEGTIIVTATQAGEYSVSTLGFK
ncbi:MULTISPECIES: MBL fold metallo-hydrolase [unclassified Mesorhizobium]|uniref:ComEC/Rec2 family competence protein n=1 Tax=unclassified Mesorhizobium TaxID=325217 RepID=UPI001FDF03D8|nr:MULTISPECIES: MBL fold metallo-hydrolase [unclassified Mesorhizobium]